MKIDDSGIVSEDELDKVRYNSKKLYASATVDRKFVDNKYDIPVAELTALPSTPAAQLQAETDLHNELINPPDSPLPPIDAEQTERAITALEQIGHLCEQLSSGNMIPTIMKFSTLGSIMSALASREGLDVRRFQVDSTNISHLIDTLFATYSEKMKQGGGSSKKDVVGENQEPPEYFTIAPCYCCKSGPGALQETPTGRWLVKCQNGACLAIGPITDSAREAVYGWGKAYIEVSGGQ